MTILSNYNTLLLSLRLFWTSGLGFLLDIHFETQLRHSAQRVPEPDPLPGISFDTRPDSVLEIIG